MGEEAGIDHGPWPARAALLAVLGAATGILIHQLTDGGAFEREGRLDVSVAAFLGVSGILLSLGLERLRWRWTAMFAIGGGLAAGFVVCANGAPGEWGAGEGWRFVSSIVAVILALPQFQAARDRARLDLSPSGILAHIWTDLILGLAACAFVLVAILLTVLLAALFALIGLDALQTLIEKGWLLAAIACAAFGGAIGLLRDREGVVETLQRVIRAILSVLAPVLAVGLVLFVLSLPFTGLEPLWESTKATTPILLVSVLGAIVLVNAVVGNDEEEESHQRALRASAIALALVGLPLGGVAAVSTARRISQYGLTPDRLWAAVFVGAVLAFAIGYLVAIAWGRRSWAEALRRTNVLLAAGLSGTTLFLALPIVSFGAISARDQVARLEQGRIAHDKFDWAALRFDFGPAGRRALETLSRSPSAIIRRRAAEALAARTRWELLSNAAEPSIPAPRPMAVTPEGTSVPPALSDAINKEGLCGVRSCRLVIDSPSRAVLLSVSCEECPPDAALFDRRSDGSWRPDAVGAAPAQPPVIGLPAGKIEVRTVTARKIYVDGKPIGHAIE
ncbi:DUF4153 domain-containing protein [Sphingosinicella sp. BN140058]|uniref:DUF4153 domain-containing protein n=1 Tax=Sphingosinicella sp. BN140058 TaxID=1892855 RepID=UPI0013EB8855|nr:DUF4153 domain-containing protein [Sphingosinicella sp. BN140058]